MNKNIVMIGARIPGSMKQALDQVAIENDIPTDKELLGLWLDRQKKVMQRISDARHEKTIKDVEKALNFEWKANGNWLNCKFIFNGAKYLFDGFLDGAKNEIVFGIEKFLREV